MIYSNSCVYLRDVAKSLRASATSPGGFAVRSPFRDFVHLKVLRNAKHFAKPPGVACNTISNHQTFMGDKITLEDISNLISIATPFILLIWFYYSQRQTLSKDYFSEL